MDIIELKREKDALEMSLRANIEALVSEFKEKTGVYPDMIDVSILDISTMRSREKIIGVRVGIGI